MTNPTPAEKAAAKAAAAEHASETGVYYVASDQSLALGGNVVLPGTKIDLAEPEVGVYGGGTWVHGLTKARCEELVKAGVLFADGPHASRKHLKGKKTIGTGDDMIVDASPELIEAEKARLAALEAAKKHKPPAKWTFTDEHLKGKSLAQMNALIVERGGAPQQSEDLAMQVLQSELTR